MYFLSVQLGVDYKGAPQRCNNRCVKQLVVERLNRTENTIWVECKAALNYSDSKVPQLPDLEGPVA